MTEWQQMFGAATRGKKNFGERKAAVRAAAAKYRGGSGGRRTRSGARRNPSGSWLPWVAIGVAGVLAWNVFQKNAASAGGGPPQVANPVPGQVYGDWEYRLFPNSALGNPQPGIQYAQAITPGWLNVKTGETRKA